MPAPPVVAKRTSRYRGPVAPEDGTGVAPADGTGVGPEDRTGGWTEPMVWSIALEGKDDLQRFNKRVIIK
jgi:hypothetical protein